MPALGYYAGNTIEISFTMAFTGTAVIAAVLMLSIMIRKKYPKVRRWRCFVVRVIAGAAAALCLLCITLTIDKCPDMVIGSYLRVLLALNIAGSRVLWHLFHGWLRKRGYTFFYGCWMTGIGVFIGFFFGICPGIVHPFMVGLIIMGDGIHALMRDEWHEGDYENAFKNGAPGREKVEEAAGILIIFKAVYLLLLFGVGFYLFIGLRLIWGFPYPRLGDYVWFLFLCFQWVMSAWNRLITWLKRQ